MRLAPVLLALGLAAGCAPTGQGSILCNDDEGCPDTMRCAEGACAYWRRDAEPAADAGLAADAGPDGEADAGSDAGAVDSGDSDAGAVDSGDSATDAGEDDAGGAHVDAGPPDAGDADAGDADAGDADAGDADAGPTEPPCGSLSALRDDFDTSERAWFWDDWANVDVSVSQQDGALRIALVAGASGVRYGGYSTYVPLPLSRPVSVELVEAPNATASGEAVLLVGAEDGSETGFGVGEGRFGLVGDFGEGQGWLDVAAYDPDAHRYWQLRPDGAVLHLETSPDGLAWTSHGTQPLAPYEQGTYLSLMGGTWSASDDPGSAAFDQLNLPGTGERLCPLQSLRDDFEGEQLDPRKWSSWGHSTCSQTVAGGTVSFLCQGSAVADGVGAETRVPLDARESGITFELAGTAPLGAGGGGFFKVKAPDDQHALELWEEDGQGWLTLKRGAEAAVVYDLDYSVAGRPDRVRFVVEGGEACFEVQRADAAWAPIGCGPSSGLSLEGVTVGMGYWASSLEDGQEGRVSFEAINP